MGSRRLLGPQRDRPVRGQAARPGSRDLSKPGTADQRPAVRCRTADQKRQNRNRVRPPGSAVKVTSADRRSMRYTFHGGGPCNGALNGAVMPAPLASGSAGHPLSAHAFAIRVSAPGSVTRAASPSITTSASRIDTAIEHRGSRATLRPFSVPAPVWNQNVPSSHMAPTGVTCGPPSSLMVVSHVVRELRASGAGADLASSLAATAAQSTGGSPSALPRFVISIRNPFPAPRASRSWRLTDKTHGDRLSHRGYPGRERSRALAWPLWVVLLRPGPISCPQPPLESEGLVWSASFHLVPYMGYLRLFDRLPGSSPESMPSRGICSTDSGSGTTSMESGQVTG